MVAQSAERGLDSALVRRIALRRLCQRAEAVRDPRDLALLGLVPLDESGKCAVSTLAELAEQIYEASAALTAAGGAAVQGGGERELLLPLTAALQVIVTSGSSSWQEDLGPVGVLHVAHTAMLASMWLAAASRPLASVGLEPPPAAGHSREHLSEEDEQAVVQGLVAVWQALERQGAASCLRSVSRRQRTTEVLGLQRSLEARFIALDEPMVPVAALHLGRRPMQDFLPAKLRGCITRVMRGSGGAAAAGAPASESEGPAPKPAAAGRGMAQKAGKALEHTAWAVIVGALVVAISEDGFGWFRFHAVPGRWREGLRSAVQQQAVQVEELLAKYDTPGESGNPSDSIMLGPWGAQSTYIQAPVPYFNAPPS